MTKQQVITIISSSARLAQSVGHDTLNLRVVDSSPTLGARNIWITLSVKTEKKLVVLSLNLVTVYVYFSLSNLK